MKKILAFALALVMILTLAACGSGNKKAIVGSWELTDGESATFGLDLPLKRTEP